MKIVFMGTPPAAAASLQALLDAGHEVAGVYTQPDKPAGSGLKIRRSAVKELAIERGLPVFQPTRLKTEDAARDFAALGADVAVVVAYGRILPDAFLAAFRFGAINVHFSLLPKYRGAAPVNWAIVNGETVTGVTTMKMDSGLDTGDVLLQRETVIGPHETSVELMGRLAISGADLLLETLANIERLQPVPQNEANASYAPILKKSDGSIDWSLRAEEIVNRIRGFQPFPLSFSMLNGKRMIFWQAEATDASADQGDPGRLRIGENGRLLIACGGHTELSVSELQPEGKKRMSARDVVNGLRLSGGEMFGNK